MVNIQEIQTAIHDYLDKKGYNPFQTVYTDLKGGLLKVSFLFEQNYTDFMKGEKISMKCDKTGILDFPETLTVIFTGVALTDFLDYASTSI
jgi:hypothetical protein